jgi:hypothetical protein
MARTLAKQMFNTFRFQDTNVQRYECLTVEESNVEERKLRKRKSASGKRRVVRLDAKKAGVTAPARTNSFIVFCGDAQQVRNGFALALNAMEANADSLMMGTEPLPKLE